MPKREPPIRHAQIVGLFAERLKELRRSRGMTQSELGRAAKITTSYVGRLEAGGAAPGIDLIARLGSALGVTVYDLLPAEASSDTEADLRERAKKLFDALMTTVDRETLLMLCPLLARLGESPTRRR